MSLSTLLSLTTDDLKQALELEHPLYTERKADWETLLDAYEASGGFADGSYIWKYRAELSDDYKERKDQARYHNYVESLVDLYVRYLLSQGITRKTDDPELEAWWRDVDGAGTSIDDFLRGALTTALATGHAGGLVDKTPEPPAGPAKADEKARVIATLYPPTAIQDWRYVNGSLVAVKLREAVTPASLADALDGDDFRYLLWDTEAWARLTKDGEPHLEDGQTEAVQLHNLGLVPLAILRPKPLVLHAMVGRSLVGHAGVVTALYNRASEEDEVLRGQAFSLLGGKVLDPQASEAEVKAAQDAIANNYGVRRVVVFKGELYRVNADMSGPEQLRVNIDFLVRELFRAAHVPYDRDSRQAESAEALALKHRELSEMLHGVAAAAQAFERQLVRFYYAWTQPTAEAAIAAEANAQVSIAYPREFFTQGLMADLEAWGTAVTAVASETWRKHVAKRIVRRVDPDLALQDPETLEKIEAEIDAAPDTETAKAQAADEMRQAQVARMTAMVQAGDQMPPMTEGAA